jgi:hypothetical protein
MTCLSFRSTVELREALRKFVDEQMEPGDVVAIVALGGMGAASSSRRTRRCSRRDRGALTRP